MSDTFKHPELPEVCAPMMPGLLYSEGQMKGYADQMLRSYVADLTPDELAEAIKYIKSKRPVTEPFDLKRAQAGAEIATRDGRKVRFFGYAPEAQEDSRVVVFVDGDLKPSMRFFNGNVSFWIESAGDLVIVVPRPQEPVPPSYYMVLAKSPRPPGSPDGVIFTHSGDAEVHAGIGGKVKKVQVCQ